MFFPPRLTRHLEILTAGIGDGSDLATILGVLVDDLFEAAPSFLGLELTLVADGIPVTVSTMDEPRARLVRASLLLPLAEMGVGHPETSVVYYAAAAGQFDDLAAATRDWYQLDRQVEVDRHLSPTGTPGLAGLEDSMIVNQALGVLITRGHTVDEARAALDRLAAGTRLTQVQAAQQVLDEINR